MARYEIRGMVFLTLAVVFGAAAIATIAKKEWPIVPSSHLTYLKMRKQDLDSYIKHSEFRTEDQLKSMRAELRDIKEKIPLAEDRRRMRREMVYLLAAWEERFIVFCMIVSAFLFVSFLVFRKRKGE